MAQFADSRAAAADQPVARTLTHVSDTALWVAAERAIESERPDAHFQDPYARQLAGERGALYLGTRPFGRRGSWTTVVRTCVFDEIILRVVRQGEAGVVLNLAAGLDTRPYRLPLPPALRWIEVDFPAVLEYKQARLAGHAPVCQLESVPLDLSEVAARQSLLERVGAAGQDVLVVTEGFLQYLTPDQVASLAADLHAQPRCRWWLTDLLSPRVVRFVNRDWGRYRTAAGVRMGFAPKEGGEFFQNRGWPVVELRSALAEAQRLRVELPLACLWRLLTRFSPLGLGETLRNMGLHALLERV
jgi:methyltransferase (TIGR00027 family)